MIEIAYVLLLVPVFAGAAPKADFYIAENGNDAWSGRLAAPNDAGTDGPLASLEGARDAIRRMKTTSALTKPVTVLLRGGTYRTLKPVEFLPVDSGDRDAPITYAAYSAEKPVISGGIRITDWKEGKDGIWTAEIPVAGEDQWRFRQLWVNGTRCIPARTPDYGRALWAAGPAKPEEDERHNPSFEYSHTTYGEEDSEVWNRPAFAPITS